MTVTVSSMAKPKTSLGNRFRSVVRSALGYLGLQRKPQSVERQDAKPLTTEFILGNILGSDTHEFYYPYHQAKLVAGLNKNQCWQVCLENEDHAYALARVIILYAMCYHERKKSMSLDDTVDDALQLVNDWLKPCAPWLTFPDELELCTHLFGPAWACLHEAYIYAEGRDFSSAIGNIVYASRPPFLPGLCQAQKAIANIELPSEIGPPA
jgi:hypothetical protein